MLALESTSVVLQPGSATAVVNGQKTAIDPRNPSIAPVERGGKPLQFVAQMLGAQVAWSATGSMTMRYPSP